MSRVLLSTGMIGLLAGALALAAQVRDEGRKTTAPPGANPAAAPNKGVADKQPGQRRNRVYLGVYTMPVEDMANSARRRLKLKDTEGVVVIEVMPDSPADEAGLQQGDVITHVNGKKADDEEELSKDLNQLGAGKPVKLAVIRDGKKQEITAKLKEVPAHVAHEEVAGMCQDNAQRIERLERKIARLEKRVRELEKPGAAKSSP
jgi:S1-C subfamily serine protease